MPSIYLGHKAFVEAGHEVLFAVPGPRARTYLYDGIQVREFRLPVPIVPQRYLWLHRLSLKVRWLAFLVVGTIIGLRLGRRFRPDVVYGQFYPAAPVAWLLGRIWKIPNITRMYGTFLFPYLHSWLGRLRKFDELLAFKIPCNYFIMTNDGTQGGDCATALGMPPARLRLWRNGVDLGMYDPDPDPAEVKNDLAIPCDHKLILALSRLDSWKRVDRVITALPAVVQRYEQTTAVIVGDGEDRAALEALARRLGVEQNVRFVGMVKHDRVARFLNAADIFVSLYDLSNAGNPLLEALCCGKCIVSLDNGATREVIPNEDIGILLPVGQLDTLPDVLVALLRDDAWRRRLGEAARARALATMQSWEQRMTMEVRLIEDLVRSAAGPSGWAREV